MALTKLPRKSLFWTYVLWLFGGLFSLHLVYLNRYRHAFAMWISFGGYFGLGWIRDSWLIPGYVAEANGDAEFVKQVVTSMRKQAKPSYGIIRFIASVVVADVLGYLVKGAIPFELLSEDGSEDSVAARILTSLFVPFGCALGVHVVGNIGRYSGSLKWPLISAYLTAPLYYFNINAVMLTSILCLVVFIKYSLCWRRTPIAPSRTSTTTVSVFLLCILLYCSLWISWFYFNCNVVDKDEEIVKCRDALRNFFNSPAWLEFTTVIQRLIEFIRTEGFIGLWKEIVEALDTQGENNALRVLGLEVDASQENITASYRKLARQWHPDRHLDPEMKKQAEEKFMSIQEAYDLLSRIKQKRLKKQQFT